MFRDNVIGARFPCRMSPELEAQIAQMRAELLRQEQDRERAEAQLALEKEERERAQRKVRPPPLPSLC